MTDVGAIFWRAVTHADFFNIERTREAGPQGGGGQSYLSISFSGLTYEQLGDFLGLDDPAVIGTVRPTVPLDVGVLGDPGVRAELTFAPRYQPPRPGDRYRIVRQNRQFQVRHPAWRSERGFPQAPDDITSPADPRMPDLTYLKVVVIRTRDGDYLASFVNRAALPAGLPDQLAILFTRNRTDPSAGVIELPAGALTVAELETSLAGQAPVSPQELEPPDEGPAGGPAQDLEAPPEVLDAEDAVRIAAGKPPRSRGRRQSAEERKLIEDRAMAVATDHLAGQGWHVDDVSATRSYDLHCGDGAGRELRVEVKGTTTGGQRVILTPNEVSHARDGGHAVALLVVHGIQLVREEAGGELRAVGGELRVIDPWLVDDHGELRPSGYDYWIDPDA